MSPLPIPSVPTTASLPCARKVVLVLDLVESVLQMECDEQGTIARWQQFGAQAQSLIDEAGGRIVKSLGDGLLVVFDDALVAVEVATLLHARMGSHARPDGLGSPMQLRMAIHESLVYLGDGDIYGSGVNQTFRLVKLARAGETILSESARNGLGARSVRLAQDLGYRKLKHIAEPVRTYRLRLVAVPPPWLRTALTTKPAPRAIPGSARPNARRALRLVA